MARETRLGLFTALFFLEMENKIKFWRNFGDVYSC